jgi:aryl-alcohol dehydrogenase-like predicted oxidoreductase
MYYRRLGKTELQVSALGFGAAEIGLENLSDAEASRLLNGVLDRGVNVIDTAECYNESETLIGKAIGDRRNEFFVFTKCGHAKGLDGWDWAPDTLRASIDRSLRRLRTDHVDLLQLHSCPKDLLAQGEVLSVLEEAKQAGKARFIGCSADGGAAALALASGRIDVLQASFSLADQQAAEETFPLVRRADVGLVVKRPISNAVWRHAERP